MKSAAELERIIEMPISSIRVGDRHRKDMGDLASLAESIETHGLLHPIIVDERGALVCGERRLRAFQSIGLTLIPARVLDLSDALQAESDENKCRKEFAPTEAVAIGAAIEEREREKAKVRMIAGVRPSGNLPEGNGQSRDKAAAAVGMSGRTYEKAKAVVMAAQANPDTFGHLAEQMDRTGKVDRAFKELGRQKIIAENTELAKSVGAPTGKFRTIVLDPPWDYSDVGDCGIGDNYRSKPEYAQMSLDEIKSLPVADLAEDNAHLYLWTTNRLLSRSFALLEAWGFRYITMLTWCKPQIGLGNYFRNSTEHVLFGVRGSLALMSDNKPTWFIADRATHSKKPQAFYDMIAECSPGPRIDMFARDKRDGWVAWGAEVE